MPGLNTGYEYRAAIGPDDAGRSVLDYLTSRYRHSPAEAWSARIDSGLVLVDGHPVPACAVLRRGQQVVWRRPPWREPEAPVAWAVLHRDDHLLAVAKPAGLPTMAGGGYLERTLVALVRRRHPEAFPVHRLDRGASGLVLFARTAQARTRLAAAFREGRIVKVYRALVCGVPSADVLVMDTPIGWAAHPTLGRVAVALPRTEDPGTGERAALTRARHARTAIEVIERRRDCALVAVTPETGRPHQIRIHLAAAGHPLVGEPFYGEGGAPRAHATRPGDVGYHLHAARLALVHPGTGRRLTLECHPPRILRQALRAF